MEGNPQSSCLHSLGIGIVPLMNKDESLENSVLNIMVETEIILEGESHGTNVLMHESGYAQPNTYKVGLKSYKRSFLNAFGVDGRPLLDASDLFEDKSDSDEEQYTQENLFTRNSGPQIQKIIKPSVIPGQKRVTGKMTAEAKRQTARNNLAVRLAWIAREKVRGTVLRLVDNQNLQYGIPGTGQGVALPDDKDPFWAALDKVGASTSSE